jgi:predicted aspartyl protease
MKTQGPKCFKCGERRHVASKYVEQSRIAGVVDVRNTRKEYAKEVSINGQKIEALIDTGSDICLMCADQYIRVDASKLGKKMI